MAASPRVLVSYARHRRRFHGRHRRADRRRPAYRRCEGMGGNVQRWAKQANTVGERQPQHGVGGQRAAGRKRRAVVAGHPEGCAGQSTVTGVGTDVGARSSSSAPARRGIPPAASQSSSCAIKRPLTTSRPWPPAAACSPPSAPGPVIPRLWPVSSASSASSAAPTCTSTPKPAASASGTTGSTRMTPSPPTMPPATSTRGPWRLWTTSRASSSTGYVPGRTEIGLNRPPQVLPVGRGDPAAHHLPRVEIHVVERLPPSSASSPHAHVGSPQPPPPGVSMRTRSPRCRFHVPLLGNSSSVPSAWM